MCFREWKDAKISVNLTGIVGILNTMYWFSQFYSNYSLLFCLNKVSSIAIVTLNYNTMRKWQVPCTILETETFLLDTKFILDGCISMGIMFILDTRITNVFNKCRILCNIIMLLHNLYLIFKALSVCIVIMYVL